MYQYDQIYPYEKLLQEVKDLIFPTIVDRVHPDDAKALGLTKEALAEVVYTQIMALAYNDEDVNAALNDLMPHRNPIIYYGPADEDAANMALHLVAIFKDYKHQFWTFQQFHMLTKEMKPYKEVMLAVKKQILAAQMGL